MAEAKMNTKAGPSGGGGQAGWEGRTGGPEKGASVHCLLTGAASTLGPKGHEAPVGRPFLHWFFCSQDHRA